MSRPVDQKRAWLVLLLLLFCWSCSRQDTGPVAQRGRIVLDAQHSEKIVSLKGEWAFYWNRLLKPGDLGGPLAPAPDGYFQQPGTWRDFKLAGKPVGPFGVATLQLTIDPGPGRRELGLMVPTIARAYRLWVDNRLVATRGVVGSDPHKEGGAPSTSLVRLEADGRPIQIVLQTSNRHSRSPGAIRAFSLGPLPLLELQRLARMRQTLFIAGGLAMIAFFCLAVFAFRRTDRTPLYFGLFVLIWTLEILIQYDREFWLLGLMDPEVERYLLRAEYGLLYISLPFAYAFFQSLYPREVPAKLLKSVSVLAGLLTLAAALVPYLQLATVANVSYLLITALMLFLAYSVVRAALIYREGAVFVFGSFAALAAAGAWDMAVETHLVREPHLMPIGVLVFALLQALHMSQRFVRNLRKVEILSAELDAKNIALELKMAETEHLSRQIVSISEEERCQISQDLHDGMCQLLTAARLRFSVLKKKLLLGEPGEDELEKSSQLLETAVNQAYDMSLGLWPVETGTGRLVTSFEELCRRTARSNNIDVAFHSNLPLCPKQSPEVTRQLYRIAQEALTNVAKHAGASHASVSVFCSPGCGMRLTVEDDGVGRARSKSGGSGGLGTRIMQHRAVVIGGELSISDRSGGGTVVSCIVSCPGARAADCPSHAEKPHA